MLMQLTQNFKHINSPFRRDLSVSLINFIIDQSVEKTSSGRNEHPPTPEFELSWTAVNNNQ